MKRNILWAVLALGALLIIWFGIKHYFPETNNAWDTFRDDDLGIQFQYPERLNFIGKDEGSLSFNMVTKDSQLGSFSMYMSTYRPDVYVYISVYDSCDPASVREELVTIASGETVTIQIGYECDETNGTSYIHTDTLIPVRDGNPARILTSADNESDVDEILKIISTIQTL